MTAACIQTVFSGKLPSKSQARDEDRLYSPVTEYFDYLIPLFYIRAHLIVDSVVVENREVGSPTYNHDTFVY